MDLNYDEDTIAQAFGASVLAVDEAIKKCRKAFREGYASTMEIAEEAIASRGYEEKPKCISKRPEHFKKVDGKWKATGIGVAALAPYLGSEPDLIAYLVGAEASKNDFNAEVERIKAEREIAEAELIGMEKEKARKELSVSLLHLEQQKLH